jgi:hypothetical protein
MESVWSKSFNPRVYSEKNVELFKSIIADVRREFKHEFRHVLEGDPLDTMLYMGNRFLDNDQIYWALTSNIDEEQFAETPKRVLFMVLMGACGADYYYKFEKEW